MRSILGLMFLEGYFATPAALRAAMEAEQAAATARAEVAGAAAGHGGTGSTPAGHGSRSGTARPGQGVLAA